MAAAPLAGAAPAFAITAANVTMPNSGAGTSQWTVTGIPLTGTLYVSCLYAGTATMARIPTCATPGPVQAPKSVTAGQTVTGTIYFYPYGTPMPVGLRREGHAPAAGLALAGGLLLGFGLRRRAQRWFALTVLALGALVGLAGMTACGGSFNGMTPGTYQYTLTADNEASPVTPLGQGVSTTINVTVP